MTSGYDEPFYGTAGHVEEPSFLHGKAMCPIHNIELMDQACDACYMEGKDD